MHVPWLFQPVSTHRVLWSFWTKHKCHLVSGSEYLPVSYQSISGIPVPRISRVLVNRYLKYLWEFWSTNVSDVWSTYQISRNGFIGWIFHMAEHLPCTQSQERNLCLARYSACKADLSSLSLECCSTSPAEAVFPDVFVSVFFHFICDSVYLSKTGPHVRLRSTKSLDKASLWSQFRDRPCARERV